MEEALIKRILPHSMEAEQSVIGSMIMSRDAIVEASELITGADFYQQQYGIVFEAMVELHDEGKAVDLVTLQERLKEYVGHTPLQVFAGAVLGIGIAVFMNGFY